jgi:hypothetical protein
MSLERISGQAGTLVDDALAAGEVEGHLVALVLHTGYATASTTGPSLSRWQDAVARLRQWGPRDNRLRTAQAVAVAGLRAALGMDVHADFAVAAKRELGRSEMPPAVCMRDDERLILGIAAGIGAGAPELRADVLAITSGRRHHASIRQACLDLWAESLVAGAPKFTADTARIGHAVLTTAGSGRPRLVDEDRIAAFWFAQRLLNAPWTPSDEELAAVEPVLEDGQRAVREIMLEGRLASALDAALVLDALCATPGTRLARQSAMSAALAVIEGFHASAAVLAHRYGNRAPFALEDEYDVQDFFRALTLPFIPDLQDEDPAPKVAGKSSRLDFTSKATRLGFELKYLKSTAHWERVRKEVLLDERTYYEHPYIDSVVVFIYDPKQCILIADRPALDADLSQVVSVGHRTVRYITRIR